VPVYEKTDGQIPVRWGALVVAFLVVLLYLPALGNGFVNWDDDIYVYANPQVRSLRPVFVAAGVHPHPCVERQLAPADHGFACRGLCDVGPASVGASSDQYSSAWVECGPGGPAGRAPAAGTRPCLVEARGAGGGGGGWPAVRPASLHVESVAWVSERKDLLAALFYLLGVLSYLRYAGHAAGAVGPWKDGAI